jgi:O-methyltransferase domain
MPSLDPVTQIQLISGGYYLSRCLQIVAELGIADLVESEPVSAADLATSTDSHPETLFRVLSLLCAHGIFERVNGKFRHSELSRVIRTDHPASMRSFARMFGIPLIWKSAIRLDESVATGNPMGNDATEGGFWRYFEDHPEDNAKFNSTMAAKAQAVIPLVIGAYDFESIPRIVDVGGGRGHLLDAIIKSTVRPKGFLFDQPHVVREATCISGDRLQVLGGDFFHDTLPEAEAYVLMEVIHDWDDTQAERILRTVRNAAPAGARLLLVEQMMPEIPEACWTATLDVIMLNLLGGRQRSLPEYVSLLNKCGFDEVREIPVGAGHSIIHATFASS